LNWARATSSRQRGKKAGTAADQINGIADRNFGIDKNGNAKKGNRYMDAFYAENPDLEKLH